MRLHLTQAVGRGGMLTKLCFYQCPTSGRLTEHSYKQSQAAFRLY